MFWWTCQVLHIHTVGIVFGTPLFRWHGTYFVVFFLSVFAHFFDSVFFNRPLFCLFFCFVMFFDSVFPPLVAFSFFSITFFSTGRHAILFHFRFLSFFRFDFPTWHSVMLFFRDLIFFFRSRSPTWRDLILLFSAFSFFVRFCFFQPDDFTCLMTAVVSYDGDLQAGCSWWWPALSPSPTRTRGSSARLSSCLDNTRTTTATTTSCATLSSASLMSCPRLCRY